MQLLIDHFYTRLNNILICKEDDADFIICKEDDKESEQYLKRLFEAYKYLIHRYNRAEYERIVEKVIMEAALSDKDIRKLKKRLLERDQFINNY